MLKRLFDVSICLVVLSFLLPFFAVITISIKLNSLGPAFYRGWRIGLGGKPFMIFKFRTMVVHAEKIGGPSTALIDPHLTKIGKFLRKYKIDELPQLVNVLKGEMSFVGPRPEVKSEVDKYAPKWKAIFSVRPGLTDLSSIKFRHEGEIIANSGIKDVHKAYRLLIQPQKLELQQKYALNHSFLLDIKIILKAFLAVIRKD